MEPHWKQKTVPNNTFGTSSSNRNFTPLMQGNQSPLHQRLTAALLELWKQKGIRTVAASIPNYPEPTKVSLHEPDLYGVDSAGQVYIGESKVGNGDLTTDHTREQLREFSDRVMTSTRKPVDFYLIVPEAALARAQQTLIEEGLHLKRNVHLIYL